MRRNRRNSHGNRGGAHYLSSVHGTEVDRINCPFYYKMGSCRHGPLCSRQHNYPIVSSTILFPHLWVGNINNISFEDFCRDIYNTCSEECGSVRSLSILDNNVPHLKGNVYVSFENEEAAVTCQKLMHGRFYNGRIVVAEFSSVCDIDSFNCEGRCRQYDRNLCNRGDSCNYLHVKKKNQGI